MSTLKADPEAIKATEPGFQSLSTQVGDALSTLKSALEAEGECWGADEIGESFAGNYTPGAEKALKAVEILSTTLSAMGSGATNTATSLEGQDQAIADALSKDS
ncbi:WXG100 family type VII secretion target [Nocardia cyriacigeorgica]|uniref:WXG100 family type VII secretion target n=1 Tax=Nocardia cyriacigeorgica TaxID=135487 RepID=UPI00245703B7|nr:hypothetical protein [Nocardia cyriacigeorgica]